MRMELKLNWNEIRIELQTYGQGKELNGKGSLMDSNFICNSFGIIAMELKFNQKRFGSDWERSFKKI